MNIEDTIKITFKSGVIANEEYTLHPIECSVKINQTGQIIDIDSKTAIIPSLDFVIHKRNRSCTINVNNTAFIRFVSNNRIIAHKIVRSQVFALDGFVRFRIKITPFIILPNSDVHKPQNKEL